MYRILVITDDIEWERLIKSLNETNMNIILRKNLNTDSVISEINCSDLIVIDIEQLPQLDTNDVNKLYWMLKDKPIVVVYSGYRKLCLSDIRTSFIVGATDVIQKPYSRIDVERLFCSVV